MLGSPIYMAPEVIKGEIYTMKADIWSVGVVLYQMIFGRCPFESKSIAKLIKMLEDEEVVIPDYPKISPTLEKLLKRILVKDYNFRIDWEEFFKFTITEAGEIYAPGVTPGVTPGTTQFGLRQSIRNSTGFGQGLNFQPNGVNSANGSGPGGNTNGNGITSGSGNTNGGSGANSPNSAKINLTNTASSSNNSSLTDSGKPGSGSPLLSPKLGKEEERQFLMKKRSPTKAFEEKEASGVNTSINYQGAYGGGSGAKKDRSNRFELLVKNHGKCQTLNQMVLDMFRLEQNRCIYIAYYLFRSIEKELAQLIDSLRKEAPDSTTQDSFR